MTRSTCLLRTTTGTTRSILPRRISWFLALAEHLRELAPQFSGTPAQLASPGSFPGPA